nr:MAG TPA: hypothetical protein [Caudoviricetes sp.]
MSKKNKLNVADMALICNALHLDSAQMRKYEKKMHKNAPSRIVDLIEKDDKVFLAVMLGYHISKMEKHDKKQKKAIADARKKYKTVENDTYWANNAERDSVGNTNATAAAPSETPQVEHFDNMTNAEFYLEPQYRVNPLGDIGCATVVAAYHPEPDITIAGCDVYSGKLKVNAKAKLIRFGRVVYEGAIANIKRFKDNVDEVERGLTCGVYIKGCTDYRRNDIIVCFEDEPDADNTNTDKAVPQTDDASSSSQYTVPKYIEGVDFKILVTDVDIDKGKLTYLDLGECSNVTPACASSVLSATNLIGEGNHCEIAGKFGIDLEYVESGVQFIRTELPTKGQIEALKDSDIWRFDTVLNDRIIDKPILVDDGSDRDNHTSRTALMPNGKLEKRQSNWRAVLIPSVTIEF